MTLNRSEVSEALRNCERCIKDRAENVKIIDELETQSKLYVARLDNQEGLHKLSTQAMDRIIEDLKKGTKKEKRKSWWRGVKIGAATATGAALIIFLTANN